jgi:uncharacterized protein (DUF4415 family)
MKSKSSSATSKARAPRLRVGLQDVSQAEFTEAVNKKLGKQRVSIMIDSSIIEFFKRKAGDRGYQTLINQTLQRAVLVDQLEVTLRKVIREELRGR